MLAALVQCGRAEESCIDLPQRNRERRHDGRLLAQGSRGEADSRGRDLNVRPRRIFGRQERGKGKDHSPKRSRGGKHVRMRQGALDKPDGIERRQYGGRHRHLRPAGQHHAQPIDCEQRDGRDHAHRGARDRGRKTGGPPPQSQVERRQRRVGIGERARWNQCAVAEQVVGRRDVVPSLIPVVGKPQEREMGEIHAGKYRRKDHPQRQWTIRPRSQRSSMRRGMQNRHGT